jgi:peptidoglycan/xylan/chitin deacetylase (PgdA/CDA1 family)
VRLDRTLTLSVFAPLRRLALRDDGESIPILMYHSIANDLDSAQHPYLRTVTSPEVFSRQIDLLRAGGYEAITLSNALSWVESPHTRSDNGAPKVVITFDDGYRDFHSQAFPVLEKAGFTATVFLPSAFIGRPFINGRDCMDAAQVRELADRGVEFGSHSVSHRRLIDLSADELGTELRESKAAIEDIVGRAVTTFSYPFRFPEQDTQFIATLGRLLDESGYRCGVTTAIGRSRSNDDRRFLPRLPINDCDDGPLLRAKLSGHYDWLRAGQRLRKRSRALWRDRVGAGGG